MIKRIIIRNGKKYIVNAPDWNDGAGDFGVGPGAPIGTLWMQSIADELWYEINTFGPSGSIEIYTHPIPIPMTWQSPGQDFGYQLLYNNFDGNVYQVYLSGSGFEAGVYVSQTPWLINSDYKPYLFIKSITDGYFYEVYLSGSVGSVELVVNQNGIWMGWPTPPPIIPPASYEFRITEIGDIRITETGDFRII